MSKFVKYNTEAGEIAIEIDGKAGTTDEFTRVGIQDKTLSQTAETLDNSFKKIQYISNKIISNIENENSENNKKPSEVTVEFAVKLGGEADFIIAKGSAEANFKVSMKWINRK